MTDLRTSRKGWVVAAVGALLAAVLLAAPSLRAAEDVVVAKPESVSMSSERLKRIDSFIQEYIDSDRIAGAVTLVARKGKVVHFEAQGWRDKENGVPMTEDTIFVLMSMTKPIVSSALMMLFEEGRFLLDDPIAKWIPEYENHTVRINRDGVRPLTVPEARPVTVRHVLTHTSGLTLNPQGKGLSQAQIDYATNHGKGWPTLAERVAHAAVIPAAFHPRRRVAVRRFHRLRRGPGGEDLGPVHRRLPPRAHLRAARDDRHLLLRAAREGGADGLGLPAGREREDRAHGVADLPESRRACFAVSPAWRGRRPTTTSSPR